MRKQVSTQAKVADATRATPEVRLAAPSKPSLGGLPVRSQALHRLLSNIVPVEVAVGIIGSYALLLEGARPAVRRRLEDRLLRYVGQLVHSRVVLDGPEATQAWVDNFLAGSPRVDGAEEARRRMGLEGAMLTAVTQAWPTRPWGSQAQEVRALQPIVTRLFELFGFPVPSRVSRWDLARTPKGFVGRVLEVELAWSNATRSKARKLDRDRRLDDLDQLIAGYQRLRQVPQQDLIERFWLSHAGLEGYIAALEADRKRLQVDRSYRPAVTWTFPPHFF